MNEAPIELCLSLDSEVFVRQEDDCYYLVLDIGDPISVLEDATVVGNDVLFSADDIRYSLSIPESLCFLFYKEVVFLQIRNYIVDELFGEIEGPTIEIIKEN